jgi:hypothetical protein
MWRAPWRGGLRGQGHFVVEAGERVLDEVAAGGEVDDIEERLGRGAGDGGRGGQRSVLPVALGEEEDTAGIGGRGGLHGDGDRLARGGGVLCVETEADQSAESGGKNAK